MTDKKITTHDITEVGIAAALVFLTTYLFKLPSINGYVHLGDSMIFVAVAFIGTRKGMLAGAVGAALADLMGGYMQWVIPTFFIKGAMAALMGIIAYKFLNGKKFSYLFGSIFGGILQIALYAAVKIPLYDVSYALVSLPGDTVQTVFGIAAAYVITAAMNKSGIRNYIVKK